MTDPRENWRNASRRRASAPSVHSSIRGQGVIWAVPEFNSHVKWPTHCGATRSLTLLGAPARTPRGAACCQQHERARWWHLQPASRLQSSSHATDGCHWCTHSRSRPRFAPRGSLGTRPSPRRRRALRLGGARCQSSGSWVVVEYVTSTLNHIGTMPGPTSAVLGTAWDAAGGRR